MTYKDDDGRLTGAARMCCDSRESLASVCLLVLGNGFEVFMDAVDLYRDAPRHLFKRAEGVHVLAAACCVLLDYYPGQDGKVEGLYNRLDNAKRASKLAQLESSLWACTKQHGDWPQKFRHYLAKRCGLASHLELKDSQAVKDAFYRAGIEGVLFDVIQAADRPNSELEDAGTW